MISAAAVIVAAGRGRRMGSGGNKVFLPLAGRPLLWWTLRAFEECPAIADVVVVVGEGEEEEAGRIAAGLVKVRAICPGGETRGQSVTAGLARLPERADIVAVHDGARPLVTPELIAACVETAAARGAALPALPITDTLKRAGPDGTIEATVERAGLYGAQTPQTFRRDLLTEAYARARAEGYEGTDDASLVERLGHRQRTVRPVPIVPGDPENLKVTVAADLSRAAAVLDRRHPIAETRVGLGYDVHRLVEGRPLVLGGVPIPHSHGLEGHSDADVLLHALCDALLGACALGDIGLHFPNTDPRYRGVDSRELLRAVVRLLAESGGSGPSAWEPRQVDVTLLAEAPRIRPHVPAMQSAIAADLGLSPDRVSVKATTSERLGFVGRQDGMAAWAVATIGRREVP